MLNVEYDPNTSNTSKPNSPTNTKPDSSTTSSDSSSPPTNSATPSPSLSTTVGNTSSTTNSGMPSYQILDRLRADINLDQTVLPFLHNATTLSRTAVRASRLVHRNWRIPPPKTSSHPSHIQRVITEALAAQLAKLSAISTSQRPFPSFSNKPNPASSNNTLQRRPTSSQTMSPKSISP